MKYCTKCGNKLNKMAKFCSKCGRSTNLFEEEQELKKEKKKEEKKEKLLLTIGTLLIILASIIFAIANWNEMTSILKVLFLSIESLLFLSLSIFSKKLNYKSPYKFLWFLGISFIPIILIIISKDKMLGEYLSYEGNGLYVYLSMSAFICFIIYFISHNFLKSNLFLYISYMFFYMIVISIFGIFKLNDFKTIIPILNSLNLLICILYSFIKNDNYKRTINIFISIILIIFSIPTYIYTNIDANCLLQSLTYITFIISLILLIFKNQKNVLVYIYPIIINTIIVFSINSIFNKYINIILFMTLLSVIMINFVINIKDNKTIKNISFISMILFCLFILINYNVGYITLCICSIILLLVSMFIIRLDDQEIQIDISKIYIPILIFMIIYSVIKKFLFIDLSITYLITSVILFSLFIFYDQKKKDIFLKITFEIFSYIFLVISGFIILINHPSIIIFISNELIWLYFFIFNKVLRRNKALNISTLVLLILNFTILALAYSISFIYTLLFICILTLILYYIEIKINKRRTIYIYLSIVTSSLTVLSNLRSISIIGICLIVVSYVFTYYLYNKNHNIKFVIKFIYTLIGFLLIDSLFNYFINDSLLANLLIFISYLIILISMFLLQIDEDRKVLCYSIVISHSYLYLINNISFSQQYIISFVVLLLVILILIYFEKVFNLKEKDKIIFELVFLGLIHIFTIFDIIILNFILSSLYIFYGFYKKREAYTIFGTLLLLLSLFINIFKIFNDITITYVLLVIGIIMLAYVFYMEGKRNLKKKNK